MLLDTFLLSEITKPRPDPGVLVWFEATLETQMHLSVLTLGEIRKGAFALAPGARRDRVLTWLSGIARDFAARILPVDPDVAMLWGELAGEARRRGKQVGVVDGLLAATAIRHGLAVVTRNVDDFVPTGVRVVNPWDS